MRRFLMTCFQEKIEAHHLLPMIKERYQMPIKHRSPWKGKVQNWCAKGLNSEISRQCTDIATILCEKKHRERAGTISIWMIIGGSDVLE